MLRSKNKKNRPPARVAATGGNGKSKPARPAPAPQTSARLIWVFDRVGRWLALATVFVITVVLVAPRLFPGSREYPARAPEDYVATVTFKVIDQEKLAARIDKINSEAKGYFQYDDAVPGRVKKRVTDLFNHAGKIGAARAEDPDAPEPLAILGDWAREEHGVSLSAGLLTGILAAPRDTKEARDIPLASFKRAADALYAHRVLIDNRERYELFDSAGRAEVLSLPRDVTIQSPSLMEPAEVARFLHDDYFPGEAAELATPAAWRPLLTELASAYAQPNFRFLPRRSEDHRARLVAAESKNPPMKTIKQGTVLAAEGGVINSAKQKLLHEHDSTDAQTLYKRLMAVALYIALLSAMVFYYVRQFRPDIRFETRNVFLVALPVLIALALGRVTSEIVQYKDAAGYAFPAALIGMLAVILLDARTAVLLVTIGSLSFTVVTVDAGLDFKVFIVALLGGYSAVTVLTSVQERKEVLKAGFVVGIVNATVILLIHLISDPNVLHWKLVIWGMGNGVMCGVIAMPALVVFESGLGVVTDIRLLELTGLGHPLLQRLENEAPGSYQHSLSVMKLSEAAAKAIGANFLLVRAGCLYHDIGKVLKPKYFSENQISLDDKSLHKKLSPYMSALVIKNHVKAGIELAKEHRLPQRVSDFIPQHQGTALITFFYHEALKRFENSQSTDQVRESDFRYPGPKPQSIETAIVMLADSVEATVTSRFTSVTINEDELHMVVQKTISAKFNDGQFDECNLTFRDLHEIRESFVKTLLGRFHHRVDYPTTPGLSGSAAPTAKRDRLERPAPDTRAGETGDESRTTVRAGK